MRLGLAAAIFLAAGLSAPALAQSGLPCDAFVKNQDGSWQATRNVALPGPGRVFNVAKVRDTIRGVATYCKANKDKRFVQAVDVVMKAEKR